ncbi:TorF family putative porin [Phenylobacterium sp.]|uniref:TorF family putative porin n=1 Tax=Phenylobacterium sp. TaxID=1871053 RepID=UPI003569DE9A
MKALALAAFALASALPAAARAGPNDWGGLFSAVMLASDYRYQGVSESRGRPVVQGYVHWWRPDGVYAGVFATKVDFGYGGAPTYEVDSYAGKNFSLQGGRSELKIEGMYTSFPDNRTPGPTLDFLQAKVQAKHASGPWTVIGLASYVPQGSFGSGPVMRVEGETDWAVSSAVTLKALVGSQGGGRGHDRTYWSLAAATTWKTLGFELRYLDNDRTRANCGFQPKACDAAVVGTATVNLPPIL